MQDVTDPNTLLGLGRVFTLFFVMLGPIKILGPFAQLTRGMDAGAMRGIALRAFALALIAAVGGGFVGRRLLEKWDVPILVLMLAGGIIFFVVALNLVLAQYESPREAPPALPASPRAAAMRITFPTVVTPHGIAAVIVILANSSDSARTANIIAILIAVMVLDLLAMLFARWIMDGVGALVLQILGAVLGVVQIALALEMILRALRGLGVLNAA
jgi:multiple antibiotic resistance protein